MEPLELKPIINYNHVLQ